VRRYENQVKDAQLKLAATTSTATARDRRRVVAGL